MKSCFLLHFLTLGITLVFLPLKPWVTTTLPDPATKKDVPPLPMVQAMNLEAARPRRLTLNGVVKSNNKKAVSHQASHEGPPIGLRVSGPTLQIRVQLDPGAFTVQKRASSKDAWADVSGSQ